MKALSLLFPLLLVMLLVSCTDPAPVERTNGDELLRDQMYYPLTPGTEWEYRIDTTSATGVKYPDIGRRISTIVGTVGIDGEEWTVQRDETRYDANVTVDSTYIVRRTDGVYLSSPSLRNLEGLPSLPIIGDLQFPKEFLSVPFTATPGMNWTIFQFQQAQFPIYSIDIALTGTFVGIESVVADAITYKECAHVKMRFRVTVSIVGQQGISMDESADFWYTRPHGLVVADGSIAVFGLIGGSFPMGGQFGKAHYELLRIVLP